MALSAIVILEHERPLYGYSLGYQGVVKGMMVTPTIAAGFPDLLTDPSYRKKLVCFTYPHVGNAGVVPDDLQSDHIGVRAVVAREFSKIKSNRLGVETMGDFLFRNQIPAIEGVDTRRIAEVVNRRGMVRAVLGFGKYADAYNLMSEFSKGVGPWLPDPAGAMTPYEWEDDAPGSRPYSVVVFDFGVKRGFLRRLAAMGCRLHVVPSDYPAEKALGERPDAVVFSAGPGTPNLFPGAVAAAGQILGKVPVWGIGIGAGVVAMAAGAGTHIDGGAHFGVHPVGRPGGFSGEMTSQSHEFWIDAETLPAAGLELTHFHLNDGSVEGFKCDERRIMGALFHPEAEPGPRDSLYLFDRFQEMMRK